MATSDVEVEVDGAVVIGFDARQPQEPTTAWKLERRETWRFLRLDVEHPRSVDETAWPSVIDDADRPPDAGLRPPLWDRLDRVRGAVRGPADLIAVAAPSTDAARWRLEDPSPVAPGSVEPTWSFLGWDVVDGSLASGLVTMRPSLDADGMRRIRRTWAGALNEAHLFVELDAANRFARSMDSAIAQHAPFAALGLWRI